MVVTREKTIVTSLCKLFRYSRTGNRFFKVHMKFTKLESDFESFMENNGRGQRTVWTFGWKLGDIAICKKDLMVYSGKHL